MKKILREDSKILNKANVYRRMIRRHGRFKSFTLKTGLTLLDFLGFKTDLVSIFASTKMLASVYFCIFSRHLYASRQTFDQIFSSIKEYNNKDSVNIRNVIDSYDVNKTCFYRNNPYNIPKRFIRYSALILH